MKQGNFISQENKEFFNTSGYLILKEVFHKNECKEIKTKLIEMQNKYADEIGVNYFEYIRNISQWRDVWNYNPVFKKYLSDERIWKTSSELMNRKGATLLHDHIISKPKEISKKIPWHQDYPFWPVDSVGLTCWFPLQKVTENMGCLEVINGSHKWQVNGPVDFLSEDHTYLDNHKDKKYLLVEEGDIVFLHGLLWHSSSKNIEDLPRHVYLTSWIPPESKFTPKHASWHPSLERITVSPGEYLNDDWFLTFGEKDLSQDSGENQSIVYHKGADKYLKKMSIFNGKEFVEKQIRKILPEKNFDNSLELGLLLSQKNVIDNIIDKSYINGFIDEKRINKLRNLLIDLKICSEAYRLHRSRNVYSSSYKEWKELVGDKWNEVLKL